MQISSLTYNVVAKELQVTAEHLTENAIYTLQLLDTITDDALDPLDGEFDGYSFPSGNGSSGGNYIFEFTASSAPANEVHLDGTTGDDMVRFWPGTPGGAQHRIQLNGTGTNGTADFRSAQNAA